MAIILWVRGKLTDGWKIQWTDSLRPSTATCDKEDRHIMNSERILTYEMTCEISIMMRENLCKNGIRDGKTILF